jgi:hypothetical protein
VEQAASTPQLGLFERIIATFVGFVFFSGALPIFANLLGFPFLPSQEYVRASAVAAFMFSFASGMSALYLFYFTRIAERRKAAIINKKISPATAAFALVLGPILVGFLGYYFIAATFPMLRTFISGKDTALAYTVKEAAGWISTNCRQRVGLVSMPFLFDEVCGVPKAIRSQLKPGMQIALEGWGTGDGLFYKRITIAPQSLAD